MRKRIVAFALVSLPLFAQTQTPCDQHSITVTGTGSAKIVPDRVSFTVGVYTHAPTVDEAFKTNNEKTHRVVDALKKHGVKSEEIQTSNFSISGANERFLPVKKSGYDVSNTVTVTREDPRSVSELIQYAVDAGANTAGNVTFFNSDPRTSRDRAIERAVTDARAQAEKLAALTGGTIAGVVTITTNEGAAERFTQNTLSYYEVDASTLAAPAIETGANTVTYSVTVTYALK
jgi:uncharacterized protein YggE